MFINKIKSCLKKILPGQIYNIVYSLYIDVKSFFTNNKKIKGLKTFTQPIYKQVCIDKICFEILLDPQNGSVDKEIFLNGSYEPHILKEIKKHIKPDSICIDIGGNIGQHTLFMSAVAGKGFVYTFEPLERLVKQIRASLLKNRIQNVEVINSGLSDKEEDKKVYTYNLNIGKTTFDKRDDANGTQDAKLIVFDNFWKNIDKKIDFVKIDVEGYEYYALQGMKDTIQKYKPAMLIEFTPMFYREMGIDSKKFLEYIFSFGYDIYDIENNHEQVMNTDSKIVEFLKKVTSQTNIICYQK